MMQGAFDCPLMDSSAFRELQTLNSGNQDSNFQRALNFLLLFLVSGLTSRLVSRLISQPISFFKCCGNPCVNHGTLLLATVHNISCLNDGQSLVSYIFNLSEPHFLWSCLLNPFSRRLLSPKDLVWQPLTLLSGPLVSYYLQYLPYLKKFFLQRKEHMCGVATCDGRAAGEAGLLHWNSAKSEYKSNK